MKPFEEQREILRSGAVSVIPSDEFDLRLKESIERGRPLRVKLGVDPTAGHIHLGWTVVLRKLRQFQNLGHQAVLIIGDFTARVGDPSGQSETRKPLSEEEVGTYAEAVLEQFRLVLSEERLEIRRNSEWLASMDLASVMRVAAQYTVARMLERDDFSQRYAAGRAISIVEFLYPLMQGYDSVAVDADVELGGTDQTFNLLVGRDLMERFGLGPQVALTMPLLEGTDGVQKMSQSLGNYIGIIEPPEEMFGKLMSIPDPLMIKYFLLTTEVPERQVAEMEGALAAGKLHPADAKRRLAWELVRAYHGEDAADEARERFDRVFRDREAPAEVREVKVPAEALREGRVWMPRLLTMLGLTRSSSEGRRLIGQGGLRIGGRVLAEEELAVQELYGRILQVGRRTFVRLVP
ncbi:MAG: tyrosine--tRNA ligase [Actinomycetota bacterium]